MTRSTNVCQNFRYYCLFVFKIYVQISNSIYRPYNTRNYGFGLRREPTVAGSLRAREVAVGGVSTNALLVPATSSMALRVRIYGAYA